MEFVLLALIALAIPVLGLVAFFRTLSLANRVLLLEGRLAEAEQRLALGPAPAGAATEAVAEIAPATPDVAAAALSQPAEEAEPLAVTEPEAFEAATAPEPVPTQVTPAPSRSLEETIGTRWAVWLGGLALALGGLFLVRYSIEQGFFGPGARIVAGALFAAALVAIGERLRRSERALGAGAFVIPSAHAPSIVTAAGAMTAFATVYAAHALYGMVGPALGFVLMAVVALAALAASALHGPALASLGLLGAFAVPLLVDSSNPQPWPVVLYLVVVAAAGYAQARLRRWRWLARAVAIGTGLWGLAFMTVSVDERSAMVAHIVIQTALAAFMLVVEPYRGAPDDDAAPDRLALAVLGGFAVLAGLGLQQSGLGALRPVLGGAVFAIELGAALLIAPTAGAALFAAGVAGAMLWGWPVITESLAESPTVLPGGPSRPPMPDALWLFLVCGALSGAALGALTWARLMRSPALPRLAAGIYAAAGTAGPLLLLTLAWWSVSDFDRSIPFALAAGGLGGAFTLAARLLKEQRHESGWAALVGYEAFAAGALGALALGLTMVFDKGSLTVALALAALGAAWVTTREPLGLLRYGVGALGVAVALRLGWNTVLLRGDIGPPIVNWLLWAYGVPALAFGLATRLLRRQRDDQVVALTQALTLAFSALLVFFELRHALTGRLDSPRTDHLEVGLQVLAALLFAVLTVSLEAFRRSMVLRVASYIFGGIGLAGALLGLTIFENPLFEGRPVVGGAVFNSLLLAYLLPSLAAFALARIARGRRAAWFVGAAWALGAGLNLLWIVLEIRRIFQGPSIRMFRPTSDAEFYTYSAAFLAVGLALLAYGVLRHSRTARLASAAYILLAVGKAFLFDMSGLTGPLRALSFIGLGAVLVGIGLVYQKWIFGRPAAPTGPAAGEPAPEPTPP
ncbi:membrane protein [Alsobacter metallidurans]|uniref:Membrane protein n=1 Tax=Alsobacter metallidurans TaxID=340221 RepID=A0A917I5S8_9HYPH|nr:DUF2339 domain-containing protein [Alsobacter metallidurans]GGH15826.1 membrane protein [Alsobacter metallidurans]